MSAFYEIKLENDRLLEIPELVEFCVRHQGQDITLRPINEATCLTTSGVYAILDLFEFRSVTIDTSNPLECHDRYCVNLGFWDCWFAHISEFDREFDYSWNERCLFGAVYGRPSAARLGLAAFLAKNFDHESLIQTKFDFATSDSRSLFDVLRVFEWDPDALQSIDLLNNKKYFSGYQYQRGTYQHSNPISRVYKNFLIDIVVEPVVQGRSFYPTEKLSRAILCRRPFIVMASASYLDYLHQMGFHSFNEFWSEEYDGYDSVSRYQRIKDLITELAHRPRKQLLDLYYQMTWQLDHNFNLLVNQAYNKNIQAIDQ